LDTDSLSRLERVVVDTRPLCCSSAMTTHTSKALMVRFEIMADTSFEADFDLFIYAKYFQTAEF
jgi:hypothetical protein